MNDAVVEFPGSIFVSKVDEHSSIKHILLDLFSKSEGESINESNQRITKTDYFSSSVRNYDSIVWPLINRHTNNILNCIGGSGYEISKLWYQQYNTDDYHGWHFHNGALSSVYYIELDSNSSRTSFKCQGKEFSLEVEEGHIITFPSYLAHESKPNKGGRKTVISFNMDIS